MTTPRGSTYYGHNGMVCAVDALAAQAGLSILRRGGNAVDAALAAAAVLAVTSPHMCGLGGDLVAIVAPPGGRPEALIAAGRAGSGADPDRLRAEGHTTMPFRGDIRSVTIPGWVDGWLSLRERHGTCEVAELLNEAVRYAIDGFPASPTLAAAAPEIAALPGADDYRRLTVRPGSTIRSPGVAQALDAIAQRGRDGFYQGMYGEALIALGGGEFANEDLCRRNDEWRPALAGEAWGHYAWTAPPPSQGYVTLAASSIAAGLDLPRSPEDPLWAHLLIEAVRQAGYDRPDVLYEHSDGEALIGEERLAPRRRRVRPGQACRLGDKVRDGGTTVVCAVDEARLGVTVVQSNASGFGAHLVLPGTGIFLHNRGVGFSLTEGHPAEYRPRRRPPHTLSPVAVTRPDGSLAGVLGTMGGDSQPLVLVQLLARWLVAEESPGEALSAGRWSLGHGGGTAFETWSRGGTVDVLLEPHVPATWRVGLVQRGHRVADIVPAATSIGHAHLIAVVDDHLAGATEPRTRFGAAAAY